MIYDALFNFWQFVFPLHVFDRYYDFIEFVTFIMTMIFIFGVIIIPLWRITTFLFRIRKR